MRNSTKAIRPAKPRADFPLFPHSNGQWAKKVRGKLHYFGKWCDDPKGKNALQLWVDQKDALLAGRTRRTSAEELNVADLVNHFLTAKERQRDAGDITARSFAEYHSVAGKLVESFGRDRLLDDLGAEDFQRLRAALAKRYGVHKLTKDIQIIRMVFKYGFDVGLIDTPVRICPTFKKPANRLIRAHRQQQGVRMFEAQELRQIIKAADQPLRAMILLGINCGFGNTDCGRLPKRALELEAGWVNYPRPKTAVERRCPLWPETIEAIRDALTQRPKSKDKSHDDLVFITKYGQPWAKDSSSNPVSQEFRKLLDRLDLHRPGLGFYALRHGFETIGGGARDQVAVNAIMGHVDASMAGVYRERIEDDRLRAVTDHIHTWLFGSNSASESAAAV